LERRPLLPIELSLHTFCPDIDFAMLQKIYASNQEETRYSPAVCLGCEPKILMGNPDPKHVSTGYIELHNLSRKMGVAA
jgi:hypothetical protein